jgi:hypothetical protein
MPQVSVILLNYNGGDLTIAAAESILAQKQVEPEIIIIDNGSSDGSPEKIAARFQNRITLIRNPDNRGFSPACNQGFQAASAKWVALMNNDAVADPFWLKRSLERAETGKKIGVVIPRIVNYFDRDKLDGIGVGFWLDGLSRARRRGEQDSARLDADSPAIASGCACLLCKKMLEELSGFDPCFFAYSEDTDLGIRAFLKGWQAVFEPRAVVYHMYSRTSSRKSGYSPLKLFYVERNRLWILFRYYPWRLILVSPFLSLRRYLRLARQVVLARGKGPGIGALPAAAALLKALMAALFSLPQQMAWRKKWLTSNPAKMALWRMMKDNMFTLEEISRLD